MLLSSRWQNTILPAQPATGLHGVPSLVWLCLQCISEHPDQIILPTKLTYRPAPAPPPNILLDHLLTAALPGNPADPSDTESITSGDVDMSTLDPRMWATVVQVFDHIPTELRTFIMSLNDASLPLLQNIQSKDTFSLITTLELSGCPGLTDSTIVDLKFLSSLAALDASKTEISVHGILSLARTLQANDPIDPARWLNGPWSLRILRLKYCSKINDQIYKELPKFPLLCAVDLRGTNCSPQRLSTKQEFLPHSNRAFFSSNLCASLDAIQRFEENVIMFPAPEEYQFAIRIKSLCHPRVAAAIAKGGGKISELVRLWKARKDNLMAPTTHPRKRRRLSEGIELSSVSSGSESEHDVSFDIYPSEIPRAVKKISDLHWYDADRQRQNSYAAMSLKKDEFDDEELMLYRVPKPWSALDQELERILMKEAERTEMQRIRSAPKTYSTSQMGTAHKRFAAVQSMAMLALSRRKSTLPQSINSPEQSQKPNASSLGPNSPRSPAETRLLKPISSLRTPEFTNVILHKNIHTDVSCEEQALTKSSSRLSSTPTTKLRTSNPPTLPSLKLGSARERGEMQEVGRDKRASHSQFEARTPPSTTSSKAVTKKSGGKKQVTGGFNWTAWASKSKNT